MDDTDCKRIADEANIRYDFSIDIFYNKNFEFDKNESNMEAASQLKLFCPLEENVEKAEPGVLDALYKMKNKVSDFFKRKQ